MLDPNLNCLLYILQDCSRGPIEEVLSTLVRLDT